VTALEATARPSCSCHDRAVVVDQELTTAEALAFAHAVVDATGDEHRNLPSAILARALIRAHERIARMTLDPDDRDTLVAFVDHNATTHPTTSGVIARVLAARGDAL